MSFIVLPHALAATATDGALSSAVFDSDTAVVGFSRGMAQVCAALPGGMPVLIAVAYSGGGDSSALLHLAHAWAQHHGVTLYAFHVHHGISPHASQWLLHCAQTCEKLGIGFAVQEVTVDKKHSVEASARQQRYAALGQMCLERKISLLITAHHLHDQAETVLLQLFRGAVVQKGMEVLRQAPGLLGTSQVWLGRPLLDIAKAELMAWAHSQSVSFVSDESNHNPRYARSALRTLVLPEVAQIFPGFQQVLARSAYHAQATARLLDALAKQDLNQYRATRGLQMAALHELDLERAQNLLRYWLSVHGTRMPSSAWLLELYEQLRTAREDAQVCVVHPEGEIHRHRQCIYWVPKWHPAKVPHAFCWQGERVLDFPDFGGQLHIVPILSDVSSTEGDAQAWGINAAWLRSQELQLDYRQGGERLKLAPNRPNRSLKQHCQSLDIPAWERQRLPLVWVGTIRPGLLFAAGIGGNGAYFCASGERVRLDWCSLPMQPGRGDEVLS